MHPHTPVQLASVQEDGVATVYIYGYIGQLPEWWLEPDDRSEEITAMALIKELNAAVAQGCQRVNIRINSVGGSVYEGEAMVAAIRECKAEVHTYNDGLVASMASTIWLAGHKRHMASNAVMMIHATSNFAWGTAKELRKEAEVLDTFDNASVAAIAGYTNMSEDEVRSAFFADYEDHWMNLSDVQELGIISSGEAYQAAGTVPTNVEQLTYRQLLKEYQPKRPEDKKQPLQKRLRRLFGGQQQSVQTPKPVTQDELRQAIQKGELTLEDVTAVVAEQTPAPAAEQAAGETPDLQATIVAAVQEATKGMQETIDELKGQVQQLGDAPGDTPSQAAGDRDPSASHANLAYESARQFAGYAQQGVNPFNRDLHPVVAAPPAAPAEAK